MIQLNINSTKIIETSKEIIEKAHIRNLYIFGGTILPFWKLRTWNIINENIRQPINECIRNTKKEDGDLIHILIFMNI